MAETTNPLISIFGGEYNAKPVTFESVASTFVAPDDVFERLARHNNTLLVGPRGSGKTTLLKMLCAPALERWDDPQASSFRAAVSYAGVFVPADKAWAEQLRADNLDPHSARRFALAAFTLHCLRALTASAHQRTRPATGRASHLRVELSPEQVHNLAQDLADTWGLGLAVADLADLAAALRDAISKLGSQRSTEALRSADGREERLADLPLLHLPLLPTALSLIERFNNLADESERRWAFLFDEMELVPPNIERTVIGFLRGSDDRLLFKVSYAPYERGEEAGSFQGPLGPQQGQDFTVLRLTYANKREGFPFSRALLEAELARQDINRSAEDVLGSTSLLVGPDEEGELEESGALDYGPDGGAVKILRELKDLDPSFEAYLQKHGFDLEHLADLPEAERARIRKIMPLAAARLAYRPAEPKRLPRLRSRRRVEFYSGAEAFYAMMEANPRWLKHVTDRLIAGEPKVDAKRQSRVLREAAEEFAGYLNVLSMNGAKLGADQAPLALMERIGDYFKERYHRGPFNPDAPGSLRVDGAFPDPILDSLRALINRGALIAVPERRNVSLEDLTGQRFRLAYLQAPIYGLPLRLDRAAPLSEILAGSPTAQLSFEETEEAR
jgi:hypothetical protein